MPRLKDIDVNYSQIKDLVCQLAFEKKIELIKEIARDRDYQENFYRYSESLVKRHGIPRMSEAELDKFLHE